MVKFSVYLNRYVFVMSRAKVDISIMLSKDSKNVLEKDGISNSVFSEQKYCITMERKIQIKFSKIGITITCLFKYFENFLTK